MQSAGAPLLLYALLLFKVPEVLTLRTLFAFDGFAARSHHLASITRSDLYVKLRQSDV